VIRLKANGGIKLIRDAVFGEIEYDYIWYRKGKISFMNNETDIMLMISGDENEDFEDGQYEAYQALLESWSETQTKLLDPILEYYQERRTELGYDIEDEDGIEGEEEDNYPQIDTVEQLLEHIQLVGIKVPYAGMYGDGGRSMGISFGCSWDSENGVGVRLYNEQVIEVGAQGIVF